MSWTDDGNPWLEPADEEDEPEFEEFDVPEGYRAGYAAVIGRPNVGKSSLLNAIVGERLAPVSPVPQTTRRRLLGILSRDDAQVVFVDTPGLHKPERRLGQLMVDAAAQALADADVVLCVVDCTREPGAEDQVALEYARSSPAPKFLVINKIDLAGGAGYRAAFQAACGLDATYLTSAVTGEGLPELTEAVVAVLPEGQPFFAPDQLTDVYEREIAADLIREAALSLLHQELPHAIAVKVEEWTERPNGMLYLRAQLVVERDSQKGIVIGKGGRMLKTIGASARSKIEGWIQRRVYLDVNVRVLEHWRRDERALRWLGLMRE